MFIVRKANERGHADHGWLKTWHTFSFADYHDEAWMVFKTLRVINEDFVAPGKGFDLHGHRDMEILTYVMQGSLRHVDTMGNNEIIRAGEFQRMTAGTGVQHMELNASQTETCHLYQIWILPEKAGLEPGYEQKPLSALPSYPNHSGTPFNHPGPVSRHGVNSGRGPRSNEGRILIASPDARDGSLRINQDAEVWMYRMKEGEATIIEVPEGKGIWLQVVSGSATASSLSSRAQSRDLLSAGDGLAADEHIELKAETAFEAIMFIV